ncbi:hypothetical protein [Mucilaginibacter sp.]|uniref:hypothetical protein n=1 Tax=Mucilaginibacter sp. TaxID=1882438 RepID=UPI0025E6940A|nr:hypothetical protein [Mucilaginibacter sp.]
MKYKLNDNVCEVGTANYPRLKVTAISENGKYYCVGTNHRLTGKKKNIARYFNEEELEPWVNHAGITILRDISTFR